MTAPREIDRLLETFLADGVSELPDRAYDAVRSEIETTRQRVVIGPWRAPDMNSLAKFAIAAAAVVVIAVVGINLLPRSGGNVGTSQPAPSPSMTQSASPAPTPSDIVGVPSAGPLVAGKPYPFRLEDTAFTLSVPNADWQSNGDFGIYKTQGQAADGAAFIFWKYDADGVFSDPCNNVKAPVVGPSAADLAAAITKIPGVDVVSPPTAVTIGGKPGQTVAIKIRDDIGCVENQFYLWYDSAHEDQARYASQKGQTIRVWIAEVDGKRVQMDGETYVGVTPAVQQEVQSIVDSVQFE
jgi:hypothetical protein